MPTPSSRRVAPQPSRRRAAATALGAAGALLAAAACARRPAITARTLPVAAPATGGELLEAMRGRYAGRWYRTATFVQHTTLATPGGGERRETWYEALAVPGRLRIDRDSTLRTGTLYASDSQFVVRNGAVRVAVPGHNPLLVLGFDVYAQPVARTAAVLRDLGLPMGPVRADTWQGRPVWVVGGAPGDLHRPQYWVDQERLVFVRLLQPAPGDTAQTFDVRFDGYRPLAGGWIAERVEAFTGGRRTLLEEYEQVRANVELDPALFDARRWTAARHWVKTR